jgi:putative hemolysin
MVEKEVSGKNIPAKRRNTAIAKLLVQFFRFKKKSANYSGDLKQDGIDFINSVLEEFQINFEIDNDDLKRIPKQGPFIAVSNHSLGGLDALIMIKMLTTIRPDFKVVVNKLIHEIIPMQAYSVAVGDYSKRGIRTPAYSELRQVINTENLKGGLGVFPAGLTSPHQSTINSSIDKIWDISILRLIKKAGVPIVPIYFKGNQSWFAHMLGGIHPLFKPMRLPAEFFKRKGGAIKIRIGSQVSLKEQDEYKDIYLFRRYLRSRVYALGTSLEAKKFTLARFPWKTKKVEPVIDAVPQDVISREMDDLRENYMLFESGDFQVFCAPSLEMPNVLKEIGRLREVTFREVGEGSNKSVDLDDYDLYYQQLIVWDHVNEKIAGAYRVGMGREIMEQFGVSGFYISSLFKIRKEAYPILSESLELGRSFIVKEYQRKPLSLFLLWKGILYFLLKHPDYRYLLGPASISNEFSKFSKNLIVSFFKNNYYDYELAEYFQPRKKFKIKKTKNVDQKLFFDIAQDIGKLDKFIFEIENEQGIPILLKKYIKLNAKIIGFNVDPDFNNCLDGLVILDIFDVPYETLKALSKEIQDDSILERFHVEGS